MENTLISIILPVYNSANFISNILSDIAKQTYSNFECIIIDDGSTDETSFICKKFSDSDKRFFYYSKENGGASSARNFGLTLSKGDYVLFVDSDDNITTDYIECFYNLSAQTKADIVSLNIHNKLEKHKKHLTKDKNIIGNKQIMNSFLKNEFGVGPTSKLFNKRIIDDVKFNTNLIINEDKLFLFEYLKKCNSAYISKEQKYFVNYRPDSISNSVCLKKKYEDLFAVNQIICSYCENAQYIDFEEHNIVNLLYIYKIYLNFINFSTQDDFKNTILCELRKKRIRNGVSFKIRFERFLCLYLNRLYLLVLKCYYKGRNK